ncbi:MAG: NhaB family Na+:H+ antiporter [Saprospiraceae bacterium]|jgi:NhaB family Na+:H+ antiporter
MFKYFLGNSPTWFKTTIIGFLVFNIISSFLLGPTITAWLFIGEFIFTLAMALKCYPLQSGGLLAIEVLLLNLTTPHNAYHEIEGNLEVILLLVFMVAGIYFMKPLLMYIFSKVFIKIRSKVVLSLLFVFLGAFLSAFLDALTVTAVLISVGVGFYGVYHKIHSGNSDYDKSGVLDKKELSGETLEQFRSFLRSLIMHGVVGTALGGVCTLVGEPQNLLIGERMGWDFIEFFLIMAPVTMPVLICGLLTTILLEYTGWFGYGTKLPEVARGIIENYTIETDKKRTDKEKYGLIVQAVSAVFLILGLALHLAPVGMIGLALIIIQTAFMGIIEEHSLGKAFEEALPFTGLLVVFFVIVAMIHDQHLFTPIIDWALSFDPDAQPAIFYIANGVLSAISDNVFVATVYIGEVQSAFPPEVVNNPELLTDPALIAQREQLEKLAVAINTGTNLPSVATPNGQAAFLFLLTSALAPLINLSYMKMVKMAFPYTIVLGIMGWIGVMYFL